MIGNLLRATARQWSEHKILQLSAALAYYSIFSIAPLLVIVVALVGWFYGPDAARDQLDDQLRDSIGQSAAETVQSMVQSAYRPGQGGWAATIGVATLLLGASGVFGQLKDALNTIWNAPPSQRSGVITFLRARLVSFGLVLVIGFLMLISLLLTAAAAAAWNVISAHLPVSKFLLTVAALAVSVTITTTLFALIFKWLPDVPVRWRQVWTGAALTALLFEIGKVLLGVYLGRESTASSYGAAGTVVLLLLWIHYHLGNLVYRCMLHACICGYDSRHAARATIRENIRQRRSRRNSTTRGPRPAKHGCDLTKKSPNDDNDSDPRDLESAADEEPTKIIAPELSEQTKELIAWDEPPRPQGMRCPPSNRRTKHPSPNS